MYLFAQADSGINKINNSENFMPVHVEKLRESESFNLYYVAHYYEQNGDLMADPEIQFIQSKSNPDMIFPVQYRMDGLGIDRDLAILKEDLSVDKYFPNLQHDTATFCTQWMRNIKNQQVLKIK